MAGLGGAFREGALLPAAAIAAAGVVAALAFPTDLALLTRIAAAALFVLSLDLVVGFAGIATLGHAALFGSGAYAAGLACLNGVTEPLLLLAIGVAAGAVAGFLSGIVVLRATGLPQLVLSIAFVQLVHEAVNKSRSVTGGSDGLSGYQPGPVLGAFDFDLWGRTGYGLSLAALVFAFAALHRLMRSPFGLLCRAIRQDRVRAEALGARVFPTLLRLYVVSGAMAGLGGALSATTAGVVGLDSVSFEWSAEALVMLVLGGAGHLTGAILGAAVFLTLEHLVAAADPFRWLTLVGAILIAIVLALPGGLVSLRARLEALLASRRRGRSEG